MGSDVAANYGSIQEELERAKSNLKGLNDNIRRIIGRDPPDTQLRLVLSVQAGRLLSSPTTNRSRAFLLGVTENAALVAVAMVAVVTTITTGGQIEVITIPRIVIEIATLVHSRNAGTL